MSGEEQDGQDHTIEVGVEGGPRLVMSRLGARVASLRVPVGGALREVTVGVSDEDYRAAAGKDFLGASIGRYANRIARGHLPVDGTDHQLATTEPGHTLHGGPDGFDKRVWEVVEATDDAVVLAIDSPDGDQGFPGRVRATARYQVVADGVDVTFTAVTDAPTVVCLTNHCYFSLGAEGDGDVRDHRLQVAAGRFLAVDDELIPTGTLEPVGGTPFDLREPQRLGDVVDADHPQLVSGLDHNYCLDETNGPQVRLTSPTGDLVLEMTTDQPGLQVYTGQGLAGHTEPYAGMALEPQVWPDSPHHPEWPGGTLRPGEDYVTTTLWRFRTA